MMFNKLSHLKVSSQQEHWFILLEPVFSTLIMGQITQSSWKGFSIKNWRLFAQSPLREPFKVSITGDSTLAFLTLISLARSLESSEPFKVSITGDSDLAF